MGIRIRPSGEEPKPDDEEFSYAPHEVALRRATDQLDLITRRLHHYTTAIISGTALNLLLFIFAIASQSVYIAWLRSNSLIVISSILTFGVVIIGTGYDRARRHGSAIFEEISEELQLNLQSRISHQESPSRDSATRPDISVRLSMRDFNVSSKLPVAPSATAGALIYIVFNLALTLLAWLAVYVYSIQTVTY